MIFDEEEETDTRLGPIFSSTVAPNANPRLGENEASSVFRAECFLSTAIQSWLLAAD
jgi:hypothetical protein